MTETNFLTRVIMSDADTFANANARPNAESVENSMASASPLQGARIRVNLNSIYQN